MPSHLPVLERVFFHFFKGKRFHLRGELYFEEGREGRRGKIVEIMKLDGTEALEQYVRSSMYYPEYRPTVFAPGGRL